LFLAVYPLVNQQPKPAEAINNSEVKVQATKPSPVQEEAKPPIESAPVPQVQSNDPENVQPPQPRTAVSLDKQAIMTAAGIPQSDWAAADYIISHESSWRYLAVNASSGATGLCQSLPASKMASAGEDYLTNPVTQMKWCNSYAQSRYGGWQQAYNFWLSKNWW
jgi:hypothetical protein